MACRSGTGGGALAATTVVGLAINAGFGLQNGNPPEVLVLAVAVAMAESSLQPRCVADEPNGTWSAGLWQINSIHGYSISYLQVPANNAAAAHKVFTDAGKSFQPWTTARNGAAGAKLQEAQQAVTDYLAGKVGPDVTGNFTGPFAAVGNLIATVIKAVAWLTDPHNWLRLGEILAGFFLLLLGLIATAQTFAKEDVVRQLQDAAGGVGRVTTAPIRYVERSRLNAEGRWAERNAAGERKSSRTTDEASASRRAGARELDEEGNAV